MRRLILRGFALITAVAITMVVVLAALPKPENTYFGAAADKWRAARAAPSPKLLIVGGSNTAFGLDSERLSRDLGMPVVNMGLNAGLGLRYMLDEAVQFVEAGDVVVVSPEYELFYGGLVDGRQQLLELGWMHPPSLRLIRTPRQVAALARGFPNVFQDRLRSVWLSFRSPGRTTWHQVYNRDAFNEYGDVVSHLTVDPTRDVDEMDLLGDASGEVDPAAFRALEGFHERVRKRDARGFIILPTIPARHYQARQDMVHDVYERLMSDTSLPVLAPPDRHLLGDQHFFDTVYHLSAEGRQERTDQLVELLRSVGVGQTPAAGEVASGGVVAGQGVVAGSGPTYTSPTLSTRPEE